MEQSRTQVSQDGRAVTIVCGLREAERARAGSLFWEAFGPKLKRALRSGGERLVTATLNLDHAFAARDAGGLLGLVGFHAQGRGLCGIDWEKLRLACGWMGALRAAVMLAPLERKALPGEYLLDGICVAAGARGRGIGSALLSAVERHARTLGCEQMRLDVVAENPGARRLYERCGFEAGPARSTWPIGSWYGVRSSTRMIKTLRTPQG